MNAELVQDVICEVRRRMSATPAAPRQTITRHARGAGDDGRFGLFATVDGAVSAATEAQKKLERLSLDDRDTLVKLVKKMAKDNARTWGEMEFAETKIGRLDHKIEKLEILELVPGVEFLKSRAQSGGNGLCLEEFAPFGVIGAITPITHSIPTLTANIISMLSAGNAIVANPHPNAMRCAAHAVREYNRAIHSRYGIEHAVCCITPATLRTAEELFHHRDIPLLVATGGPAVARAALASRKRAIVAGPGNPPVVVDETACVDNAAKSIVQGAAYDNNLLCIGEKQVFAVDAIFDKLIAAMQRNRAVLLDDRQVESLTKNAFTFDKNNEPHVVKELIGRDATALALAAGASVPPSTQLLFGVTDFNHPFVKEEQMMPFIPFVRCRNVDEAIARAVESEHGYRHTALIHSRNIDAITKFARAARTTIFVVNGPSMAGLGLGGEGYLSYSIATPTGEGVTNPLTFTRFRRTTLVGSMRMI
ncbi:aldehyde dehydrogenase EutE [soil metagenome]